MLITTRLAVVVSLLLAFQHSAGAAITFVKSVGTGSFSTVAGGSGSIVITVPAGGVAAGNTVLFSVGVNGTGGAASSGADSRGNTYAFHMASTGGFAPPSRIDLGSAYIGTALLPLDVITISLNALPANTAAFATVSEFAGIVSTSPFDSTFGGTGTCGFCTTLTGSPTGTTAQANEVLFSSVHVIGPSNVITPGAGYTSISTISVPIPGSTDILTSAPQYQIVSSIGAFTSSADFASTATSAVLVIGCYKDSVAPVQLERFTIE